MSLPSSTVGALSEMRVIADLLSKGYYVYRSVSPNSPCDIVIVKGDTIFKVEISTTIKSMKTGKLLIPKKLASYKYDIMALVTNNGEAIEYWPPLP